VKALLSASGCLCECAGDDELRRLQNPAVSTTLSRSFLQHLIPGGSK
jgi:hypothetical protein